MKAIIVKAHDCYAIPFESIESFSFKRAMIRQHFDYGRIYRLKTKTGELFIWEFAEYAFEMNTEAKAVLEGFEAYQDWLSDKAPSS